MEEGPPRKRPRPVVSCLRCRDKKLRCDRGVPCENCIKAQRATECTYNNYPAPRTAPSIDVQDVPQLNALGSSQNIAIGAFEDLRQRVARIEELLSIQPAPPINGASNDGNVPRETTSAFVGKLVVKGSRSRYHGPNDRSTLLNQFAEAKDWFNNVSKDAELVNLIKQVQFLQGKAQPKIASPAKDPEFSLSLLKLREFLPPRHICQRSLDLYFQHFEGPWRILHIPTVKRQFEQIWETADPDICTTSAIIPTLTAIMVIALAADQRGSVDQDEVHRTYLNSAAVDLIQAWLDEMPRKQHTELSTLQVEVLLLMARKALQQTPSEKIWGFTGALVRSAIVLGLHTALPDSHKLSPYKRQMRRRLWGTIVEMDLQASITAGMPTMAPELDIDSIVPANLNDIDFDESSAHLPEAHPSNVKTDCLPHIYLVSSLPQRIKLMAIAQNVPRGLNVAEVVREGEKMEALLSEKQLVSDVLNTDELSSGELYRQTLLDLYMRRPLLWLYRPLLLGQQNDQPEFSDVQRSCLKSSLAILSYQDYYETSAEELTKDIFYLSCKNDILVAALTICQLLKLRQRRNTARAVHTNQVSGVEQDDLVLFGAAQKTIAYMTSRIGQKGGNLKDVALLSAVLQTVGSTSADKETNDFKFQETKKTLVACKDVLMKSLVPSVPAHDPSYTTVEHQNSLDKDRIEHSAPATQPLPTLDFPLDPDTTFVGVNDLNAEYHDFQFDLSGFGDEFNLDAGFDWTWNSTPE